MGDERTWKLWPVSSEQIRAAGDDDHDHAPTVVRADGPLPGVPVSVVPLSRAEAAERERDELRIRFQDVKYKRWYDWRDTWELREAAQELLRLKDGPRDDAYREAKPRAWERLRAALSGGATREEQT